MVYPPYERGLFFGGLLYHVTVMATSSLQMVYPKIVLHNLFIKKDIVQIQNLLNAS